MRIRLWMAGMAISFAGWAQEPLQLPPPPEALPEAPMAAPAPQSAPEQNPASIPSGWTLAFSWSPEYCKRNLGIKEPQCQQEHYFVLSGLVPRFEGRAPDCPREALPRELMPRALETMRNESQLKKVWRLQGNCSGLAPAEYVLQLERAARRVSAPERFRRTDRETLKIPKAEFKDALRKDNPGLMPEAIALQCRRGWLETMNVCVDAGFNYRACGPEAVESCPDPVQMRAQRPALRGDGEE